MAKSVIYNSFKRYYALLYQNEKTSAPGDGRACRDLGGGLSESGSRILFLSAFLLLGAESRLLLALGFFKTGHET